MAKRKSVPSKRGAAKPRARAATGPRAEAEADPAATAIERVGLINRIHAALRSTLQLEDLHSIILSTLISRSGFGFSRAMLLAYDEAAGLLRGLSALGGIDRDQHRELHKRVQIEEAALADMVKDLHGLRSERQEEEAIFKRSLRDLSSHSFWITTYQIFSARNELQDAIRGVELPFAEAAGGRVETPLALLREVAESPTALTVGRRRIEARAVPRALRELLPGESLWKLLRTQKGPRLLIIADKLFDEEPLEPADALHLDWFAGQAAMGIELAEMYRDLKQAYESLQELDSMKSSFLATVSHELRTPLTAINGYLQLLLGNKLGAITQGQREVLERVIDHAEMLTGKVNDLIEIAELDRGETVDLQLEPVDPLNVLIGILPRVESRRARKQMTVEPVVDHAIPRVTSNELSLERIFFHLLDNALKFGHPGTRVRIEFAERDGNLAIAVRDEGIGITAEGLKRIFEAFYQIDSQLTRSYEGLGVGLTIIKRQLDLSGGQIEVDSHPGHGSTFTILYPLA